MLGAIPPASLSEGWLCSVSAVCLKVVSTDFSNSDCLLRALSTAEFTIASTRSLKWNIKPCNFSIVFVHSFTTPWQVSLTWIFAYRITLISFMSKLTSICICICIWYVAKPCAGITATSTWTSTEGKMWTLSQSMVHLNHQLHEAIWEYQTMFFTSCHPLYVLQPLIWLDKPVQQAWASEMSVSLNVSAHTLTRRTLWRMSILYLYLYLHGDLQIPRWDITQMGECASLMAARRWAGRAHRRWWWRRHSLGRKAVPLWDGSGEELTFISSWGGRDMAELVFMVGLSSWVGLDK